ncbi:hypothetical protein A3H16_03370 [Candidatus Kaiserbacteria bacterium RIFCSPLOWO2_12_FULL_53_8]|uniref:Uncharacterized protein n=2 Tax=Candidatus Kaiseribacteriota TaxID=1752734 RepID=A0A1F6CUN9_9BACT|nr:MAG: hypothetical protein A2851_04295 [Candidatus Kaiserbacteria bacterium RIFCSPHIGHO2_01_FULL_53_29]OGG91497.1 MAG: hypothetical protein A3H16_03370 [Candidatus Kaiserbacteria bacterium RIFCSPLOWO2_12_FULL_53_8]
MVSHTSTKPIAKTGLRHDDPRYAESSGEARAGYGPAKAGLNPVRNSGLSEKDIPRVGNRV